MKKVMFVTVGTSLFHSASWEADGLDLDVPNYRQWTSEHYLYSPDERKKSPHGKSIEARLEFVLNLDNAGKWTDRLARDLLRGNPDKTTLMRHSAEIATILKLFEEEARTETLPEFLRSYSSIYFPYDSSGQGGARLANVAAHHLASYLNRLAAANGMVAQPLPIPGLSSDKPEILLGENTGLNKLLQHFLSAARTTEKLDFIGSGGYKLYGIYLYQKLAAEELPVRLLYIYENAHRLVKIENVRNESFVGMF